MSSPFPCPPCDIMAKCRTGAIKCAPDHFNWLIGEAVAFGMATVAAFGAERMVPALCHHHREAFDLYAGAPRS